MHPDWIHPDWPAPANVAAVMTTRAGGVSRPPFDSFNTATHVGDDPAAVEQNRAELGRFLPSGPLWLDQVHGNGVAGFPPIDPVRYGLDCGSDLSQTSRAEARPTTQRESGRGIREPHPVSPPQADACVAFTPGQVCVVQTADCLPVLFSDTAGTVVAAAHAGWRGLAGGVLEATVAAMGVDPSRILAWMGAAIGPSAFEVGPEVREAFISQHPLAGVAFRPTMPGTLDERPGKWLADIYALARIRLAAVGVEQVFGGGLCTYTDRARFHSYRRDGQSGRMASLIWLRDQ